MQDLMELFAEEEAKKQAQYEQDKASGLLEREEATRAAKSKAEWARLERNGCIQTEPDEEEEDED